MITGTLINTFSVLIGSSIGLFFKKQLSTKYQAVFFQVIGLFTIVLGIKMSLLTKSPLLMVISLVLGTFIGEKFDLNEKVEQIGNLIKEKSKSKNEKFTEGLVTAFLLFCIGSMSIVGAIEEGFGKTSDLLLTKSVMDFFSATIL